VPNAIEVVIEFVISAITVVTGLILYGYSPGYTNSAGQLTISSTGISGAVLVIIGLFFFGVAMFTLSSKTLDENLKSDSDQFEKT
jgi:hypothetical protein